MFEPECSIIKFSSKAIGSTWTHAVEGRKCEVEHSTQCSDSLLQEVIRYLLQSFRPSSLSSTQAVEFCVCQELPHPNRQTRCLDVTASTVPNCMARCQGCLFWGYVWGVNVRAQQSDLLIQCYLWSKQNHDLPGKITKEKLITKREFFLSKICLFHWLLSVGGLVNNLL